MGRKRKARKELPQRVYFNRGSYFLVTKEGKWINLGQDFKRAIAKWSELVDVPERLSTMGKVMDRYMLEVAPLKSDKTYHENLLQIKPLKEVFGDMRPDAIKPIHVYQYLDIRGKTAPVGANREKALLSHIFTMAIRWGIVERNPCREVKRLTEKKRDRYITDDELQIIRGLASDKLRCMIDIAYLTALRIGDVLKIRLSDITDEGIVVKQEKTGKRQIFELTPALEEVISRTKKLRRPIKGFFLFVTNKGTPYTYDGFKSIWQRVVEKSEIENVHFHDIRAKALTDAKKLGYDAQLLAGHEHSSTTDRYIKDREFDRVVTPLSIKKNTCK